MQTTNKNNNLGIAVKSAQFAKELTQVQLAEGLHVSTRYLKAIGNNDRKNTSLLSRRYSGIWVLPPYNSSRHFSTISPRFRRLNRGQKMPLGASGCKIPRHQSKRQF